MARSTPFVLDEILIATSTPLFRKASPTSRIFKKVTRIALVVVRFINTFKPFTVLHSISYSYSTLSVFCRFLQVWNVLESIKCLFFLKEKESTFFLESLHFLNINITYIAINIFSEMSPACNYMYVRFDLIVQTRSKEYPLTDSLLIDY